MKQHKRMCRECPFRANALPGWLGNNAPEYWHHLIHSGGEIACHMAVGKMERDGEEQDVIDATAPLCVGSVRYRHSVCKSPPTTACERVLEDVKNVADQPTIAPMRFYEHHTREGIGEPLPPLERGQKPVFPTEYTVLDFWQESQP